MPAERRIGFILPGISVSEKNKELQFTMESASTVRDVTLTLYQVVVEGTTHSAWANYNPFSGSIPQEGIMLANNNGDVFIRVVNLEDSDIGDTYNVTISADGIDENFKSAVEMVLADNSRIIHINNTPEGASVVESYETIGAMFATQLPVMVVIDEGDYSGYLSLIWSNFGVIQQTINPDLNLLLYNVYELIFDDEEKTVSVTRKLYTSALTPSNT